MNRKKILSLILILTLVFMCAILSACGANLAASAGGISLDSAPEEQVDLEEPEEEYTDGSIDEGLQIQDEEYGYEDVQDDSAEEVQEENGVVTTYVLNTNTKKFHKPECGSVKLMKEKNKSIEETTREDIIARGYDPCENCDP